MHVTKHIRFWAFFLFFFCVLTPPVLARQLPVQAFARSPAWSSMALSKNGSYVAGEQEFQGEYVFSIFKLNGVQMKRTHALRLGDNTVRWITWLSDTRLMVSIGFADRRYTTPTTETRLVAMNFDGSEMKNLFKRRRKQWASNIQDTVVDRLRFDPDHILMAFNSDDPSRPRVYKVNVHNAKQSMIQAGKKDVYSWRTDQSGEVRIGYSRDDGKRKILVREVDGKNWRVLRERGALSQSVFNIYGFTQDPNVLYVGSNHEGGTTGLYEYDLRTDQFTRKIFKHPEVDIAAVSWDVNHRRIIRVFFILDGYQSVWMDPVRKAELAAVQEFFPGKSVSLGSRSMDGKKVIVFVDSTTDGGQYYVFDKNIRQLITFGPNYPELAGEPLGEIHAFNYRARDGLEIPAFLSLPAGINDPHAAARLPLVVMPHGGPTSRDYLDFDPFIHLLTNRGYAVLQMNFRGSWGYGAAFQAAGYREWGRKMQDDVTDGVKYLIAQGIADPARVCIFGGSYGGYAAMMGAVKTPDLYQCAVSLNGVFDLRKFIRYQWQFIGGRSGLGTAHIGDYSERDFLDEVSPSKRAGEIKIPVLVISAKDDRTVPYDQSKTMVSALKRAGVDHQYIELEKGGHSLLNAQSRGAFMTALDTFLAQHLH